MPNSRSMARSDMLAPGFWTAFHLSRCRKVGWWRRLWVVRRPSPRCSRSASGLRPAEQVVPAFREWFVPLGATTAGGCGRCGRWGASEQRWRPSWRTLSVDHPAPPGLPPSRHSWGVPAPAAGGSALEPHRWSTLPAVLETQHLFQADISGSSGRNCWLGALRGNAKRRLNRGTHRARPVQGGCASQPLAPDLERRPPDRQERHLAWSRLGDIHSSAELGGP